MPMWHKIVFDIRQASCLDKGKLAAQVLNTAKTVESITACVDQLTEEVKGLLLKALDQPALATQKVAVEVGKTPPIHENKSDIPKDNPAKNRTDPTMPPAEAPPNGNITSTVKD